MIDSAHLVACGENDANFESSLGERIFRPQAQEDLFEQLFSSFLASKAAFRHSSKFKVSDGDLNAKKPPGPAVCIRLGTNLKVLNLELPEPQENRTSNLTNLGSSSVTKLLTSQKKTEPRTKPKVLTTQNIKKWVNFSFDIGTNLKIRNLEPPEYRFLLQNRTSNLPNYPKKTKH